MACSQACADSCGQVCDTQCALACGTGCSSNCGSNCYYLCSGCTESCSNSGSGGCPCSGGCTNDCVANCTYWSCSLGCASCQNQCGGCSLGCSGGCSGSCMGDCKDACNFGCSGEETDDLFQNLSLEKYLKANNIKDITTFIGHELSRRGFSVEVPDGLKLSNFRNTQAKTALAQYLLQELSLIYGQDAISPLFKYAQTNETVETILGNILIKFAKQAYNEIV